MAICFVRLEVSLVICVLFLNSSRLKVSCRTLNIHRKINHAVFLENPDGQGTKLPHMMFVLEPILRGFFYPL